MTSFANRWLLITAASVLALSVSACNKPPAATDTSTAADATAPATDAGNAMAADTSATNSTMGNTDAGSSAPAQ